MSAIIETVTFIKAAMMVAYWAQNVGLIKSLPQSLMAINDTAIMSKYFS